MKRWIPAVLLLLLLAGCGGPELPLTTSPPAPSPPITSPTAVPTTAPTAALEPTVTFAPGEEPPRQKTGNEAEAVPIPAQPPVPTPETTAAPVQSENRLAAGSWRSDTGTALNLAADWQVSSVADGYTLTIALRLESYSLSVGERIENSITVNGVTSRFRTPAFELDSGELSSTPLFTYTAHWNSLPEKLSCTVVWDMRGSYSGKELETVSLTGEAALR